MGDDDFDPAETPVDRTVHWDPVLRPPNRRSRIIVVSIIWVLVIAGVLVAQISVTSHRNHQPVSAPAVTTTTAPPTTRESVPSVVPGYQAVVDATGAIVYDVPADWQVSHIGDGTQAQDGDWRLTLTMLAAYRNGFCTAQPARARALSGTGALNDKRPADTVTADTARHVADWAYGSPGGQPAVAVSTHRAIYRGQLYHLATAMVTVHEPGSCLPASALVDVSVKGGPGNWVVTVALADQRFTGAVGQSDLNNEVTSLRTVLH
jgi:hypothetical protein